jgi:hypothetical protein
MMEVQLQLTMKDKKTVKADLIQPGSRTIQVFSISDSKVTIGNVVISLSKNQAITTIVAKLDNEVIGEWFLDGRGTLIKIDG